jgi:hypothetical protein
MSELVVIASFPGLNDEAKWIKYSYCMSLSDCRTRVQCWYVQIALGMNQQVLYTLSYLVGCKWHM